MSYNIPSVYLIGAPKCGTSAMRHYLHSLGLVRFPLEEPGFWDSKFRIGPDSPAQFGSLEDYMKLYPGKNTLYGDGSVYIMYDQDVVRRIIELSPHAKFIIMLRDPVDAAISMYSENLKPRRLGREPCANFEDAWNERVLQIPSSISGICSHRFDYPKLYKYSKVLPSLVNVIDKENLLFLSHRDFKANNKETLNDVIKFLNLGTPLTEVQTIRVNERSHYADNALSRCLFALTEIMRKNGWMKSLRGRGYTLNRFTQKRVEKPLISQDLNQKLKEYFNEDCMYVESVLGLKI